MNCPRIVILSMTDISSSTATGSLLRELFANFPRENIFQITALVSQDEIARKYSNRCGISVGSTWLQLGTRIGPVKRIRKKLRIFRSDLVNELSKFRPDVVYIRITDNLYPYRELAELVSEKFRIPIVTHIMDDYESAMDYLPSPYMRTIKQYFLRRDLKFLFGFAKLNFVISDAMNLAFKKKYGVNFEVFHNGIDPVQWDTDVESSQDLQAVHENCTPFRMVMAGSIDERKDANVISQVSRVVHHLNNSGDLNCQLILNVPIAFFPSATRLAETYRGVTAQKYQPLIEYRKLLSTSDCLLLARNSDEITKAYTGLSFHNKLPEYLASGSLILCIGPAWDGSVQFLKENRCGVVMSNPTDSEIRRKIMAMALSPQQFDEHLINAKKAAIENFDINQIRIRFRQRLCEAAGTSTR